MAPTDYPQNLFHSGAAKPLTLAVALSVPASGDVTMTVTGNAAAQGWPAIPNGQKMVVTIGRGTQYEAKYLISSVSSGQDTSTLTVLAADRNYDGTTPVDSPAGTTVEHTVSATEMATINDHMRTKLAHGSDGQLVDQNSTQTLSNKTLNSSTLNDPILAGARFTPVGTIVMWPSNTIPEGFLACNGQTITAQAYPELFAIIGGTVPNLTDSFVKAGPVNLTPQSANGKKITEAQLPAHSHTGSALNAGAHTHTFSGTTSDNGAHNHGGNYRSNYIHYRNFATSGGAGAGVNYTQLAILGQTVDFLYQTLPTDGYHNHTYAGTTSSHGDHGHAVTTNNTGGGEDFDVQPKHVVLQYIICAKPQGA